MVSRSFEFRLATGWSCSLVSTNDIAVLWLSLKTGGRPGPLAWELLSTFTTCVKEMRVGRILSLDTKHQPIRCSGTRKLYPL
jgi:hypothetical protein